ncbi:MAG: hypothetical protein R2724_10350 [Bryobacterales bacterium]
MRIQSTNIAKSRGGTGPVVEHLPVLVGEDRNPSGSRVIISELEDHVRSASALPPRPVVEMSVTEADSESKILFVVEIRRDRPEADKQRVRRECLMVCIGVPMRDTLFTMSRQMPTYSLPVDLTQSTSSALRQPFVVLDRKRHLVLAQYRQRAARPFCTSRRIREIPSHS